MEFAVYADLSRPLSENERYTLYEALEVIVPGGGCVGRQKDPNDEVYFVLEAPSETEARTQAEHFMNLMLQGAALDVEYTLLLVLQRNRLG